MVERLDNALRMHSWIVNALVVSRYTGNMESFCLYAMVAIVFGILDIVRTSFPSSEVSKVSLPNRLYRRQMLAEMMLCSSCAEQFLQPLRSCSPTKRDGGWRCQRMVTREETRERPAT